jgi:alanine-glyoxylate transaminase / serine-glyoxylate transaminase / serine-pyruvate transaminase
VDSGAEPVEVCENPGMKISLGSGRDLVAIPGPSVVPDRVLAAMHRGMPNIYEGELIDISNDVLDRLPALVRTRGKAFVTISNGHGAWEMAITNTLSRGDTVLVLESGRFATSWGDMAAVAGVKTEVINAPDRGPVDARAVEEHLRSDVAHDIKAILVVQVDTASSVLNDIAAIRRAIDAAGHPALLMVDGIASIGCERFEMDAWGVDVTVAASQKGLMTPPGLGFVWASERALEAHARADLRTGYWDWTARSQDGAHYLRYCGTPPVSHLYGLHEALDMLDEEGLDAVWRRHAVLAAAVHAAVEAWSAPGGLELNIVDPSARSNAVTTILTGTIDGERLRARASELGLTLGVAIGKFEGSAFRIGHMGHLNPPMLLGTLGTVEAILDAMDARVAGSGVAAAAASIASAVRDQSSPN